MAKKGAEDTQSLMMVVPEDAELGAAGDAEEGESDDDPKDIRNRYKSKKLCKFISDNLFNINF